jgi:hypothetical protein
MKTRILIAGVLLLALAIGAASGQTTQLKYSLEKGKTYRYADTMIVNTTQEMMGQEMKIFNRISAVSRVTVERADADGKHALLFSLDTIRVATKSPRMDSTLVPTELLHKRSRLTLSSTGDVVAREVVDSIRMASGMRGAGLSSQREFLSLPVYSGRPVKVGEKWTSVRADTQQSMGGMMVTTTTLEYTLLGKESYSGRDAWKLNYSGTSAIAGKGTMMGSEVFTEGSGKLSGTAYVDGKSGMLIAADGKMESDMTAAVTGQQNMTIPINQSGTTKHVLIAE